MYGIIKVIVMLVRFGSDTSIFSNVLMMNSNVKI